MDFDLIKDQEDIKNATWEFAEDEFPEIAQIAVTKWFTAAL